MSERKVKCFTIPTLYVDGRQVYSLVDVTVNRNELGEFVSVYATYEEVTDVNNFYEKA